jgi:hypothetical protein
VGGCGSANKDAIANPHGTAVPTDGLPDAAGVNA